MELRKEIESLIKTDNDLTMDNLRKLVKMNDFINECLRTHSPVSGLLPRKVQADVQLGKYTLKKGANINIAMVSNTHYGK
jgi:cytochrome P450